MSKLVIDTAIAATGVKASLGQACQGQLIPHTSLLGVQVY